MDKYDNLKLESIKHEPEYREYSPSLETKVAIMQLSQSPLGSKSIAWIPNELVQACYSCGNNFTLINRKYVLKIISITLYDLNSCRFTHVNNRILGRAAMLCVDSFL